MKRLNRQIIPNAKQKKVMKLMCEVLDLKKESEEKVVAAIEALGIPLFFENIDVLDIEEEEKDRIRALKKVVDTKAKSNEFMKGEN